MMRHVTVAVSLLFATSASAWVVPAVSRLQRVQGVAYRTSSSPLNMALDYNDPIVGAEYALVQPMTFDEVEEELLESGVRTPPSMNEMDIKFMLVEIRLRAAGQLGSKSKKKEKPTSFSSKFEEAIWTKPVFGEFYEALKSKDDHNSMNVVSEYLNSPEIALSRYGKTYKKLLREIETALNAAVPVTSPKLSFSGFPANMGEQGCKMTLEAVGTIVDFDCKESDDFPVLEGTVTFEDLDSAKKAVEQYNGMDMGMGAALELASV